MSIFRVNDKVNVGAQILVKVAQDLLKVQVNVATHDDKLLGVGCKHAVETDSSSNICERACSKDRNLARVLVDLLDHKLCSRLTDKCAIGVALEESRFADS